MADQREIAYGLEEWDPAADRERRHLELLAATLGAALLAADFKVDGEMAKEAVWAARAIQAEVRRDDE